MTTKYPWCMFVLVGLVVLPATSHAHSCNRFSVTSSRHNSAFDGIYTRLPSRYNCDGRASFKNSEMVTIPRYIFYAESKGWVMTTSLCNSASAVITAPQKTLYLEDVSGKWSLDGLSVRCTNTGCSHLKLRGTFLSGRSDYQLIPNKTCNQRPAYQSQEAFIYYVIQGAWQGWVGGPHLCVDKPIRIAASSESFLPEDVTSPWERNGSSNGGHWRWSFDSRLRLECDEAPPNEPSEPNPCIHQYRLIIALICISSLIFCSLVTVAVVCKVQRIHAIQQFQFAQQQLMEEPVPAETPPTQGDPLDIVYVRRYSEEQQREL